MYFPYFPFARKKHSFDDFTGHNTWGIFEKVYCKREPPHQSDMQIISILKQLYINAMLLCLKKTVSFMREWVYH